MAFLKADKTYTLYGLEIKEKFLPTSLRPNRKLSNGTGKAEYVTIHNTDDILEAKGTNDAEQYARATHNGNMGGVSVQYFIDEIDCWHILPDDEVGYHAADGKYGPGNNTSIAIEIIMDGSGSAADLAAENRGAKLAAILLYNNGLSIDRLTTHNRWYPKKYCPYYILPHWSTFKAKVEAYLKEIKAANAPEEPEAAPAGTVHRVQVGAFKDRNNADDLQKKLEAAGFETYMVKVDGLFKVQLGAFGIKFNAESLRDKVKAAGFDAFVTTKGGTPAGPTTTPAKQIKEGDTVRLKAGAKDYNGGGLASFLFNRDHTVAELKGDRAVITYGGEVVAAVKVSDLVLS